jgi:hypothetical protein
MRHKKWISFATALRTDKDSRKLNPWYSAELPEAGNELAIWSHFYECIFGANPTDAKKLMVSLPALHVAD